MSEDEGLPYIDEDRYEYTHEPDETSVTVNIDERRNGGRVGVYHYDAEGSRLAYYRFRINNLDERMLDYQGDDDEVIPDAVDAAIHRGGWRYSNLYPSSIKANDPVWVMMDDVQQRLEAEAGAPEADLFLEEYFAALARILEDSVATTLALSSNVDQTAEDFREITGKDPTREAIREMIEELAYAAIHKEFTMEERELSDFERAEDLAGQAIENYRDGLEWQEALLSADESLQEDDDG